MAYPFTSPQKSALRSGPLALFLCVDLDLDSGTVRFWDGPENAEIDSEDYIAIGAYAGCSSVSMGADIGGAGVELTLDATKLLAAGSDITDPAYFLSTIISDGGYRQRPMRVYFSLWNAETGAHIRQVRRFTGLIDQMEIREEPAADGAGHAILKVRCESMTLRYGQRNGRVRGNEDQQEIYSGDKFFELCAGAVAMEKELRWGHKGATTAPNGHRVAEHGGPIGNVHRFLRL